MNLTNSLLPNLVTKHDQIHPQIYFKSSLIALARAMEDLVLVSNDSPLVIANFQHERFFRPQQKRFSHIAQKTDQVYILAVPEAESSFSLLNSDYETIPLQPEDNLAFEKFLVIIGEKYSACFVGQQKNLQEEFPEINIPLKQEKRFEGFWTFDVDIARSAAQSIFQKIRQYRPELTPKIEYSVRQYNLTEKLNLSSKSTILSSESIDIRIFTQKLVTYLQASQYRLIKAYKKIAIAQHKEYLINKIAQAQNKSLELTEILQITVQELGNIFPQCRSLVYLISPQEPEITIDHEYLPATMPSLRGKKWTVANNPVFIIAQTQDSPLVISNVNHNIYLHENPILKEKIKQAEIKCWLMIPIRYQTEILGVLELHYGGEEEFPWSSQNTDLIKAVAYSTGIALTQAKAYGNLVELNKQLAVVECIQNNLIAVVGHELRTPLSTIRICLESLASERNMDDEIRETMLSIALSDSERLARLIQDFLTLSKLEAAKAYRNIESVTIDYPLQLAISRVQKNQTEKQIPSIDTKICDESLLVQADIEGLTEVFYKLIDNACKFTAVDGSITITTHIVSSMLEIIITDTGRGIEENQLELIFDRFSQSENYLRRTVSGAGLGLVICRKIIEGMNGKIWAKSKGLDCGSEFHFTLPIEDED